MKKIFKKIIATVLAVASMATVTTALTVPVSAAGNTAVYAGKAITPDLAVYDDEGNLLVKGTDYDLVYENNVNVGEANIKIVFKGNYSGERNVKFTIVAKELSEDNVTVADIPDTTFTGTAVEPKPVITTSAITDADGNPTTLQEGTDYDFVYEDNTNVGTAKADINFKGNYNGSLHRTFSIGKRSLTEEQIVTATLEPQVYTGNAITPEPVVKDGETVLEKGKDYDVAYEDNTNVGTAKVNVTLKGNYEGTKQVTFDITPVVLDVSKIDFSGVEDNVTFTGGAVTPEPVIKYGDVVLEKGKDYDLSYENNENVGDATVKVTFKGNYSGEVDKAFTISPLPVDEQNIQITIPAQTYTGEVITPEPVVKHGDFTLEKDKDYTVSYADNTEIGTAKAVIDFKGNYTGTIEKAFEIKQKASTGGGGGGGSSRKTNTKPTVTDGDGNVIGNVTINNKLITVTVPDNFTPPVIITLPEDKTLTDGNDYTIKVKDKSGKLLPNVQVIVKDKNNNQSTGYTDDKGVVVVPNRDIKIRDGQGVDITKNAKIDDKNITVKVPTDFVPPVIITLPDDKSLKGDEIYNITVINENDTPVADTEVILRDKYGKEAKGTTNTEGKVVLPDTDEHKAYISGYLDNSFLPDGQITRAETASMLQRAMNVTDNGNKSKFMPFSDVREDAWYRDVIILMAKSNLINGYLDSTFKPEVRITRAEFAAMLVRIMGVNKTGDLPFEDVKDNHWAKDYIYSAYEAGYIKGYEDNTFRPDQAITRSEAVQMINTALGRANCTAQEENPFTDVKDNHWAYKQILEASIDHKSNMITDDVLVDVSK